MATVSKRKIKITPRKGTVSRVKVRAVVKKVKKLRFNRKALEDSISHWERMIKWAGEQPPSDHVEPVTMSYAIGEVPSPNYCALCRKYGDYGAFSCPRCPLGKIGQDCCIDGSAYDKVSLARVWSRWIKAAKNMLKVLKSLRSRSKQAK